MRGLRDFKVPDFKFPKFNIEGIKEEIKIDNSFFQKKNEKYEVTEYKTIKEIFDKSTKEYAKKEFVLEKFDHKKPYTEITYEKFREDVIGLGTALNKILKLKDKRVVIIGETTYEWYVSYMAMLCGTGIAVPIDKELPANEIENLVKRSKASAVIYSKKKEDIIEKVKDNLKDVKYFIEMYSDDSIEDNEVGMNYLIEEGKRLIKAGDNSYMDIKIDPEEFKVLIFTSGTTSQSKGVMLCNRNLAENINAVSAYVKIYETDRLFSVLPLHHTYESTIGFLLPMACGASVAICEGLKHIVPNLKESKPTALIAVPILIESLYKKINANIIKSKKEKIVDTMIHLTNALKDVKIDIKRKVFKEILDNLGGRIRIVVSAAAPIDPKVGAWVEDIGIKFLQGYGLTETAPIAALTPEFEPNIGAVGKPVICAEIKIDNPNENGEGEILIKSKTLMIGYYENEEATNESIFEENGERWFRSGDVGYLDENGNLFITGRSKNVIVTQNGKNIYPEEIEELAKDIKEIKECMVYGKEEEGSKELTISIKAIPDYDYIKEQHGDKLSDEEIHKIIWEEIKKINKKLTSYKAIKNLEIKKDEFEKTTTMKIKRFAELKKDKEKANSAKSKILVASDIHGSAYYAEKLEKIIKKEDPDKIVLLGDLYYHGPRNPLTKEYDPQKVCKILNGYSNKILATKGNCDAEVDEMISEFKMEDKIILEENGKKLYFTHGHKNNIDMFPEEDFDVLIYGHFHTGFIKEKEGKTFVNVGSISLPKNETKNSYLIIENNKIILKDIDMKEIESKEI